MMKYWKLTLSVLLLSSICLCSNLALAADGFSLPSSPGETSFLTVDEAFKFSAEQNGDNVLIYWEISEEYYLYQHSIKIEAENASIDFKLPKGKPKVDEYFGDVEIYTGLFEIPVTLVSAEPGASLSVRYQGCTEGLCYPPKTQQVALNSEGLSQSAAKVSSPTTKTSSAATSTVSSEESALLDKLKSGNLLLIALTFFVVGLGLSLTPCVYPMYPVLSSIILGQGQRVSFRHSFILSLTYVQGVAITYMLIGMLVASLQLNISAYFQQPMFLVPVLLILVALALSMFGFYELQLPSFIRDRLNSVSNKQQGGSIIGVFLMGAISTLVLSPCTAAPLITAFGYIATTGDLFVGGVSLYAMGMGMGAPLIAIGCTGGQFLPRAGVWMNAIKAVFGVAILGVALRLADPLLPGPVYLVLWALLLITSSLYLKIFVWPSETHWQTFWKGIGFVLFTYGIILLLGAAMGNSKITRPLENLGALSAGQSPVDSHAMFTQVDSRQAIDQAIAAASAEGKTVMIDFFADWCTACFELADYTFPAPEVQAALKDSVLLQVDLSATTDENKAIEKKYGILGLPMILFFDQNGQELSSYRVAGFVPAAKFAEHVQTAFSAK